MVTDRALAAKIHTNIADLLCRQESYQQAVDYFEKALNDYKKTENRKMETYTLLDIGDCQRQLGDKSTRPARLYYKQALAVAPDDTIVGNIYQRIGLNYYHAQRHDSARHYLQKSLRYPYYKHEQAVRLLFLGLSFYDTAQLDSAKHYLKLALEYPSGIYQKSGCYTTLHKIAQQEKDTDAILHYASLHAQYSDSIGMMDTQLGNELHDIQTTKVANRERWIGGLAAGIALLAGIGGLLIKRIKRHKKQATRAYARTKTLEEQLVQEKQEQTKLQQQKDQAIAQTEKLQQQLEQEQQQRENLQQLEAELKQKYEQEETRALERRRQDYISRLQEACTGAVHYPTLSPRYKTALLTAYDEVLHWNDTEQFLACIDKDFNRFAYRIETCYLKRRSPNHAAARLCTLLLLNAPDEHIQALMDYKPQTYKQSIARLCKRFDAADREGLLIHLLHIMISKEG